MTDSTDPNCLNIFIVQHSSFPSSSLKPLSFLSLFIQIQWQSAATAPNAPSFHRSRSLTTKRSIPKSTKRGSIILLRSPLKGLTTSKVQETIGSQYRIINGLSLDLESKTRQLHSNNLCCNQ
ncbi:hypothetical protein FGO68_gene12354 [Halteria grandinella]|uniref:Uncharacterized protein n=1 Tax=Halteria grandinella TaxID=5974 RepID=A0A8J8P550_HALGN|nr:hypothetical protein FGO68_gene12354 [Halteria grandinella]